MKLSARGCIGEAGSYPTVRAWIVPSPGVQPVLLEADPIKSAPDDHFTISPYCRVIVSGIGRVSGAGRCPTVRAGIVSTTGVQKP